MKLAAAALVSAVLFLFVALGGHGNAPVASQGLPEAILLAGVPASNGSGIETIPAPTTLISPAPPVVSTSIGPATPVPPATPPPAPTSTVTPGPSPSPTAAPFSARQRLLRSILGL